MHLLQARQLGQHLHAAKERSTAVKRPMHTRLDELGVMVVSAGNAGPDEVVPQLQKTKDALCKLLSAL